MTLQLTTHNELSNEPKITKQSIHKLFKQQSSHIDDNTILQLVNILGINNILDEFLSDSHNNITQIQLQKLHQLFSTPEKYQQQNKTNVFTKINSLQNQEIFTNEDEMCYKFDVANTYLHAMWGEHIALKIVHILYKPMVPLIWGISGMIFIILNFFFHQSIIYPLYQLFVSGIAWHFFFVLLLHSANKDALKLVTKTFEFWIKTCSIIICVSIYLINIYVLTPYTLSNKYLRIIADITTCSNILFVVVSISIFDALHMNRFAKMIICTFAAIIFTVLDIQLKLRTFYNADETFINLPQKQILSLRSIQMNMIEILIIFSWKQAFLSMTKKNRCVLIKYYPYIEWIYDDKLKDNNESINIAKATNDNTERSTFDVLATTKYIKKDCIEIEVNDMNINTTTKDMDDSESSMTSHDIDRYKAM